jgi:hypothetical protein
VENSKTVDQRRQRIFAFIKKHEGHLARQGGIVATYRYRGGRAVGPYYRVAFRVGTVQQSVYMGTDLGLLAEVHLVLQELQRPYRERRALLQRKKAVRKVLAECRDELRRELARRGLRLQGYEVRGWQTPGPRSAGAPESCEGKK